MDLEDFSSRFVVAVEDFSGAWSKISESLHARLPLRHLSLKNKFGNSVPVSELHIQYWLSDDKRLQRLAPHVRSPVTWFRNPYAHLLVVSCEEVEEYKRAVRPQLKAFIEREKEPLSGAQEWVIAYVRPQFVDPTSKGPRKVFDALRHDFNLKRRERCVRLDPAVGSGARMLLGADELERYLKDAIKASFEARRAAYEEEVKRLMESRLEPDWSFSSFYLSKDSLAIMMEAAGLLEDALRDYLELEACYVEAVRESGPLSNRHFGGNMDGDDVAQILKATWRETRRSVLPNGGVAEFNFRQYLFACQARVLMKLKRPFEVAERGLDFVMKFSQLLARQEAAGQLRPLFREAWAFSACLGLASATARMYGAPLPRGRPQRTAAEAGAARPHRRSNSFDSPRGEGGIQRSGSRLSRSQSAENLAANGPEAAVASLQRQSTSSKDATRDRSASETGEGEAEARRLSLKRLKVSRDGGATPDGSPASGGHIASALAERPSLGSAGPVGGWPEVLPLPPLGRQVDWDMGVPSYDEDALVPLQDPGSPPPGRPGLDPQARAFYRVLGNLYASARKELMRLGASAQADLGGNAANSPMAHRMHGLSPMELQPKYVNKPADVLPPPRPASRPASPVKRSSGSALLAAAESFLGTSGASITSKNSSDSPRAPGSARAPESSRATDSPRHSADAPPRSPAAAAGTATAPRLSGEAAAVPKKLSRFASRPPSGNSLLQRSDSAPEMSPRESDEGGSEAAVGNGGGGGGDDGAGVAQRSTAPEEGVPNGETTAEATEYNLQRLSLGTSTAAVGDLGMQGSMSLPKLRVRAASDGGYPEGPGTPGQGDAESVGTAGSLGGRSAQWTGRAIAAAPGATPSSAAGPSGRGHGQSGPDPRDPAFVEHEVATDGSITPRSSRRGDASGDDSPGGHSLRGDAFADGVPGWMSDWRIKLAMSSQELYRELFMELSGAAAVCYEACGRLRNAALMHSDVAECLLAQGQVGRAAALVARQARLLAHEGWALLEAEALNKLRSCQKDVLHAVLPLTCLQLLSVLAGSAAAAQLPLAREAVQEELLRAAALGPAPPSASIFDVGALTNGRADALRVLHAAPLPGRFSRFFGLSYEDGYPVLLPTHPAGPEGGEGAAEICVGDVALVEVVVTNSLSVAVTLEDVTLTLALLQDMAVMTPAGQPALQATRSMAPGGAPDLSRVSMSDSVSSRAGFGAGPLAQGAAAASAARRSARVSDMGEAADQRRFGIRWQETEELRCPLASEGGPTIPASPLSRSAGRVLRPGPNRLHFQAAPLKRGLYALKTLQARLQHLPLLLPL